MKKRVIIPLLLGIFIFSSVCSHIIFTSMYSKSTQKKETTSISNSDMTSKSEKPESKKTADAEVSKKSTPQITSILDILGHSNKMAASAEKSMMKWRSEVVNLAKQNTTTLFINGDTSIKEVALTFDDGPDSNITPKVISTLKENKVPGTFFFIGENIKKFPAVVKAAYESGNLVLSHSYTHPDFTTLPIQSVKEEMELTEKEISKITGKTPAIIRPPYGAVNQKILDTIIGLQYKPVLWSIDTLDWSQKEKDNIVKNVLDNVRPGDIILMHSNGDKLQTLMALPEIITGLKEKGYKLVTVSELLNIPPYR